ncbi:MAG: carboxypeptidase regulatory-like domain-containing protein [Terracidiphilus sp.]
MTRIPWRNGLELGIFMLWLGSSAAQVPGAAAGREISGVVVSAKSGEPLAEVLVMVLRSGDRKSVTDTVTDAEGRFAFENLGDGKFDLVASRSGYVRASYQQHDGDVWTSIVTGDGLISTGLRFELSPQATIYGTVADESGDPVPMARLSLYNRDKSRGTGKLVRVAVTMADAMGNFEFSQIAAGSYFACAFGTPWYATRGAAPRDRQQDPASESPLAALDVAYAPTCYPDVTEPNAAEAISLAAGERVALNVVMHAVPTVHMLIQSPDWDSKHPPQIPQLSMEVFGIQEQTTQNATVYYAPDSGNGVTNSLTAVEITGIPPGQYEMELPGQSGFNVKHMSVDAADGASIDLAAATSIAALTGKVTMASGGSMPAASFLWLRSRQGSVDATAPVGADGSFTLQSVRAGEYDVMVSAGNWLAITNLNAKGGALRGHVLKVGGDPIELMATVTEANAVVNGVVKRDGVPKAGVFVVLVPNDPKAERGKWQPNQSDSDGSFNFFHVAPGEYTVAAIEGGWTLDWSRPEVITPYLARGAKLIVAKSARQVNLNESLEAQPLNLPPANKTLDSAAAVTP